MAAQKIHEITAIPPLQELIMRNLNIRDFINATNAGIVNLNIQQHLVRQYIGAGCNESARYTNQQGHLAWRPCTNGPLRPVQMRWCDKPLPTWHGGPMNHNVCYPCYDDAFYGREVAIKQNLEQRRSIQCKRCSLRQRRLHPGLGTYQTCDCLEHIQAGWKCRRCFDDIKDTRFAVGDWRSDRLLRCHKVTDKRTKRKKIVYKDPPRVREACATPNCGGAPWTVPGFQRSRWRPTSHPKATFMCLNCNGIWIYQEMAPNRP